MNSYKELIVWQKSIALVTQIYNLCSNYPQSEQFGLTSQLKRSSISIPSNIAEGFGRNSKNDFIRFLNIAVGSLFELQTQLEISKNLSFLTEDHHTEIIEKTIEIEKMLKALIRSLKH